MNNKPTKSTKPLIWEVLAHHSLPLERPAEKLIQHVRWYDEVLDSNKSFPMYGSIKKDGNNCVLLVIDGFAYCFSRKGKRFQNCERIEHNIEQLYLSDNVYLTEIENSSVPRAVMNGWVQPRRKVELDAEAKAAHESTKLWFFDVLTLFEFQLGRTEVQYKDRHARLFLENGIAKQILPITEFVTELGFKRFAMDAIRRGEEGVVVHQCCDYLAGHKGYRCMKIVKKKTLDLKLVRILDGKGKNVGIASTFILEDANGKEIKAGAGLGWNVTKCRHAYQNKHEYIGNMYEVYSFEQMESGALRQPKIGDERHDKIGIDTHGQTGNNAEE